MQPLKATSQAEGGIYHRLRPGGAEVDDRQAAVTQRDGAVRPEAVSVGPRCTMHSFIRATAPRSALRESKRNSPARPHTSQPSCAGSGFAEPVASADAAAPPMRVINTGPVRRCMFSACTESGPRIQVSFAPPPCDEFTTMLPAGATRVSARSAVIASPGSVPRT